MIPGLENLGDAHSFDALIETGKVWFIRGLAGFVVLVVVLIVLRSLMGVADARERGRIVLVVGPQGAGKSTFAAMLATRWANERPSARDRRLRSPVPRPIVTNAELSADWDVVESWRELIDCVLRQHAVILLDEAHLWLPSGRQLPDDRRMVMTQLRKRRCDLVLTAQDDMQVAKSVRKLVTDVWDVVPIAPGVVHLASRRGRQGKTLERKLYRPRKRGIDTLAPAYPPEEWAEEDGKRDRRAQAETVERVRQAGRYGRIRAVSSGEQ